MFVGLHVRSGADFAPWVQICCLTSAFIKRFFGKLRTIEICHPNKKSSCQESIIYHIKRICSRKLTIKVKGRRYIRSFTKKIQKVLMKIEEMANVFLNSTNFAKHAFLNLVTPISFALNLKALIKFSKVSSYIIPT